VTNDYRPEIVKPVEDMAVSLQHDYDLVSNFTLFPAQITSYQQRAGGMTQLAPDRLDLPLQDLRLPIADCGTQRVPGIADCEDPGQQLTPLSPQPAINPQSAIRNPQLLEGFVRLDSSTPTAHIPIHLPAGNIVVASNFRSDDSVPDGTPVLALTLHTASENDSHITLQAGMSTASWNGQCPGCSIVASWMKLAQPLGAQSYAGAYSQFEADIWGAPPLQVTSPITSVDVKSLLSNSTVYFWGLEMRSEK
jgi:hypothetical protein